MSADSLLGSGGLLPELYRRPAEGSEAIVPGSSAPDPVDVLAGEFAGVCAEALDADEVAVALEASGMGDRIALDSYGQRDVFALAEDLFERVPRRLAIRVAPRRPGPLSAGGEVLLRSALYLTPLALALGAAHQLASIPGWVTAGALVTGWSTAQGLAYLGYLVGGRGGDTRAARFLLAGFLVVAGLWTAALLGTSGAGLRNHPGRLAGMAAVSLGELALFAAVTVALVTRRERALVRAAVPCWIAAAVLARGPALLGGRPEWGSGVGVALLVSALLHLLFAAYRPAFASLPRGDRRWPLEVPEVTPALGYAVIGAAQAILLAAAVLAGGSAKSGLLSGGTSLTTVPLLVGALAAEYLMIRHRARLDHALETSTERAAFRRKLLRTVWGTLGVLTLGILGGLAVAASWAATDSLRALQLACGVLLAGQSVLTLLLITHRRLGLAMVLVGFPALFVVSSVIAVTRFGLVAPPLRETLSYAAVVLGVAVGLSFLAAVRVLVVEAVRP